MVAGWVYLIFYGVFDCFGHIQQIIAYITLESVTSGFLYVESYLELCIPARLAVLMTVQNIRSEYNR